MENIYSPLGVRIQICTLMRYLRPFSDPMYICPSCKKQGDSDFPGIGVPTFGEMDSPTAPVLRPPAVESTAPGFRKERQNASFI